MSQNEKKYKEELHQKILEGLSSWRLIYDEERDIYIKVAYVSSVTDLNDESHDEKKKLS